MLFFPVEPYAAVGLRAGHCDDPVASLRDPLHLEEGVNITHPNAGNCKVPECFMDVNVLSMVLSVH